MENPIKMDDLGVPLFQETPTCTYAKMYWHRVFPSRNPCQQLALCSTAAVSHDLTGLRSMFARETPGQWIQDPLVKFLIECSHTPNHRGTQEFPMKTGHGPPKDWKEPKDLSWKNGFQVWGWLQWVSCPVPVVVGSLPLEIYRVIAAMWCRGVNLMGFHWRDLGFTRQRTQISAQLGWVFLGIFKQTTNLLVGKRSHFNPGHLLWFCHCYLLPLYLSNLIYTSNYSAANFRVWLLMAAASCLICPTVYLCHDSLAKWGLGVSELHPKLHNLFGWLRSNSRFFCSFSRIRWGDMEVS